MNIIISAVLLFSISYSETSYPLKGTVLRFFSGFDEKHFTVVAETDEGLKVHKLSSDLEPICVWDLPKNVEWLNNEGYQDALVFVSLREAVDTATRIRGSLQTLNMITGKITDLKLPVRTEKIGAWVGKNNRYLFGGRLFDCTAEKPTSTRVSGAPYNVVSSDERFSAQFIIKRVDGGVEGNVTVEDLKNSDMLNVGTFRMADTLGMLMNFAEDSRYLYYRSGDSPALYDMKELRGLGIPDVKYKYPAYVDAYLNGDKYFFFHDYQSIVMVGKKSFEVEDVVPNPFGDIATKIVSAKGIDLAGLLYETRKGTRLFTRVFTVTAKGQEPKSKTWELPVNTLWVTINGKKAKSVYYDNQALNLFMLKLN
ncbi:MAG: hypothetical protein JNL74_19850 [Fibrobacteres bacterium]|nr:hypothetical protein [Fibrobacterota bacterium]